MRERERAKEKEKKKGKKKEEGGEGSPLLVGKRVPHTCSMHRRHSMKLNARKILL